MAYTKYPWKAGKTTPINATNLNHIEDGIYDAHELHRDMISGMTPTYVDWTADPTDGADITDGDISTLCTTGNVVIGGAWQYAYFEWDLGALYTMICTGFGEVNATVGTGQAYLKFYNGTSWDISQFSVCESTQRPFRMTGGRGSKIRLGITSSAAATVTPNIREFSVWRMG